MKVAIQLAILAVCLAYLGDGNLLAGLKNFWTVLCYIPVVLFGLWLASGTKGYRVNTTTGSVSQVRRRRR